MSVTTSEIDQLYRKSAPQEINGADALMHFVILRDEGYVPMVGCLSVPYDTTIGRRMMSELIEPRSVQRNGSAVLGPMVTVHDNIGEWHMYGAVLYGLRDKNAQ